MNALMYGLGLLAFSFLSGQFLGEELGVWLGVKANVGGVGFAMIILILAKDFLEKKNLVNEDFKKGIDYWNVMYVPVVIAMSASQNVKVAVSSGFLAIIAGLVPAVLVFWFFPYFVQKLKPNN